MVKYDFIRPISSFALVGALTAMLGCATEMPRDKLRGFSYINPSKRESILENPQTGSLTSTNGTGTTYFIKDNRLVEINVSATQNPAIYSVSFKDSVSLNADSYPNTKNMTRSELTRTPGVFIHGMPGFEADELVKDEIGGLAGLLLNSCEGSNGLGTIPNCGLAQNVHDYLIQFKEAESQYAMFGNGGDSTGGGNSGGGPGPGLD